MVKQFQQKLSESNRTVCVLCPLYQLVLQVGWWRLWYYEIPWHSLYLALRIVFQLNSFWIWIVGYKWLWKFIVTNNVRISWENHSWCSYLFELIAANLQQFSVHHRLWLSFPGCSVAKYLVKKSNATWWILKDQKVSNYLWLQCGWNDQMSKWFSLVKLSVSQYKWEEWLSKTKHKLGTNFSFSGKNIVKYITTFRSILWRKILIKDPFITFCFH